MSNVITLKLNEVSFEKIIKGNDRNKVLGMKVRAYKDAEFFHHCVVEDTMPGMGMLVLFKDTQNNHPGLVSQPVRYKGFVFPGGLAIILGEMEPLGKSDTESFESFNELETYENFLKKLTPAVEEFKTGIEIKFSPAVSMRLKNVIDVLKDKKTGLSAFLGKKKIFGSSESKEKKTVIQHSKPEEMEEQGLAVKIDEKFMLTIIDMFEVIGSEFFRVATGLAMMLDFSGFKAKMRTLEDEANKREEELNK